MTKNEAQALLDAANERSREMDRDRAEVDRLGQKIDDMQKDRIALETSLYSARRAYARAEREYTEKWVARIKS